MPRPATDLEELKRTYERRIVESAKKWYLEWCKSITPDGTCEIDEEMVERFVSSVKNKGDEWLRNFLKSVAEEE